MKAEDHVGPGWAPIVQKAIDEIEAKGGKIFQVKQKFGELRIYLVEHNDEVDEIIQRAERECAAACETCGKPGHIRPGSWMKTLCDDHAN